MTKKDLFWLASYPKSGNTWARKFLDAYHCRSRIDLNNRLQQYVRGDHAGWALREVSRRERLPLETLEQRLALRGDMLDLMVAASPVDTLTLKTHHGRYRAAGVDLIPPQRTLGAVYLVRDPRAVAVSWSHHMGVTIDDAIAQLGETRMCLGEGRHLLRSWTEHVDSWAIPADDRGYPVQVIRYEDLLAEPQEYFRLLLNGLGWNFDQIDDDWFAFALEQSALPNLQAAEREVGFREKRHGERFFREGKADGWRAVLTDEQVRRIETQCGVTMFALGYELEQLPLSALFEIVKPSSLATGSPA